jgi:hypothetical protein
MDADSSLDHVFFPDSGVVEYDEVPNKGKTTAENLKVG